MKLLIEAAGLALLAVAATALPAAAQDVYKCKNSSGQLGIGNATGPSVCTSEHTPCSLVPVQVKGADGVGKFSGSVAISAGQEHAAALRAP